MHDPKAHSKGGTLENTINGRADEESAGAPQHLIHPGKDITKLYGMSRPCTHIFITILPPAWQAIKQYSVLSLAGCLFQRASERDLISVAVRLNRTVASLKGLRRGIIAGVNESVRAKRRHPVARHGCIECSELGEDHAIFIADDTTRLRTLYYIHIYYILSLSLYLCA